jgi:hypothetical protein
MEVLLAQPCRPVHRPASKSALIGLVARIGNAMPAPGAGRQMTAVSCLGISWVSLAYRSEYAVLLGEGCLTKLAAHRAEDVIILRQRFHLMSETPVPQCHQTSFFCEDAVFDASNVLLPKA